MLPISSLSENKSIVFIWAIFILVISCFRNEIANAEHANSCREILSSNFTKTDSLLQYYTEYVEIVGKCSSNYHELETIRKCENKTTIANDLSEDIYLFTPVTVKKINVTYWNIFCAICNYENGTLSFWDVALSLKSGNISKYVYLIDDDKFVFDALEWKKSSWVASLVNDSLIYTVQLYSHLPLELETNTVKCRTNRTVFPNVTALNWDQFQIKNMTARPDVKEVSRRCIYYDEYGDECERNKFYLEGYSFTKCIEGKIIIPEFKPYFYDQCKKPIDGIEFDNRSWYIQNNAGFFWEKNWIFLCGKNSPARVWKNWETRSRYISIIFVIVYLVLVVKYQEFDSNTHVCNIALYFYSVAVLIICVYYQWCLSLLGNCSVRYFLLIYFIWCNAFCVSILVYECWRTIISSLRASKLSKKDRIKRSLVYFIAAWILPLIPTAICSSLIEILPPPIAPWDPIDCPRLSKYTLRCQNYSYVLAENGSVIYLLFGILLVPSLYFVCMVKFDELRSMIKKSPLCLLARGTYLMIFYCLVIVLLLFENGFNFVDASNSIGRVFLSFHGVIMFFVFGLNVEMVKRMLRKCGFNVTVRETRTEINLLRFTEQVIAPLVKDEPASSQQERGDL